MAESGELSGGARLWGLIAERTHPESDTDAIDAVVWDTFGEHWTVMATDLSGFSRHVAAFGIMHFLQVIHEFKVIVRPVIEAFGGIVVKAEADSLIMIFKDPHQALDCAVEMQHACQLASVHRAEEEKILLCIGVGHGPILRIDNTDIFGVEVNGACKLGEDTAGAHEILVTSAFRKAYTGPADFEPIDHEIAGVEPAFRLTYELAKAE